MKKSHILAIAALLATVSFYAPSAFAFTTDSGTDTVISTGTPHLTDPDEQTGAFFGGANSEPSSYFTSGGGGSSAGTNASNQSDDNMYHSGYSIRPDKDTNNAHPMPSQ